MLQCRFIFTLMNLGNWMQGIITLLLILSPMFVGFALPTSQKLAAFGGQALTYLIYLILIVIGIELGLVDDLVQKVGDIIKYLVVLITLTIGFGAISLVFFDKFTQKNQLSKHTLPNQKPKISLRGSLAQLICLAIGFMAAKFLPAGFIPPEKTTTILLMVLLFLVGVSLKGSGIGLKQALVNKTGLQVSVIFIFCTTLSGIIFASIFHEVTLMQGLALASGYGWYSLSGTIMTDAYGAVWGSVALLNDLAREVIALIFIPWVMHYSTSVAVSLGGVTSLDFTLPTILQAGGTQIMPIAISFGFIVNIVSPVLMVLFSSFG